VPRSLLPSHALVVVALLGAGTARAQQAPRIAGFELSGSIDPPGRVEALLADVAPVGSFFVEVGEADREGTPISTVGRLRRALDQVGYDAIVTTQPAAGGQVRLQVHLRAYERVRQIFVERNWPIRQDEIIRRLSLRPGQPLPLPGPDRESRLALERSRVEDYLHSQGYLDARVRIEVHPTDPRPPTVNLLVKISYGPPEKACWFLYCRYSRGFPIGSVSVRGNTVIRSQEIADRLRHQDWQTLWFARSPFQQSVMRDDLQALTQRYRDLGYAGARLTYTMTPDYQNRTVKVQVEVNERKRIDINFEGNHRISSDRLRDQLTIFTRGAYDDYEVESSAEAIAQYYRERGHMLVRVNWRRQRVAPQADRITFAIDEGPSLRVRGVQFVGNRHLSSATLSQVVNVKEFPLLGAIGLGAGGYASLRQLATDADNLTLHYHNEGFPDASVRCEIAPVPGAWYPLASIGPATEADWRTAQALYVRFLVDEGPLVSISQIRFESMDGGPLPRDDTFLRELLLSAVGWPFRPALVREDTDRLKRFFGDQGYPQASVEPAPNRTGADESVVWQVKLGPQVHVGPVFVRGNFLTPERTIMLWVPLRPGSVLTTTDFERGQRNLALIQLFNNASPISFPGETATDPVVPMLIEVEERHDHAGILRVGGGVSTDQVSPGSGDLLGFYGSLGYEHRNLFGLGWTLLGQARAGTSLANAQGNFVNPRFLGTLFRLELAASYLSQATVRLGDIRSGGGSIGFGREMYPGVDAVLRYNLRDTFHTEFLVRGAGPDEEQQTVQIGTFVGSLSLTVDWLRLDNPLVPTRGFKLSGGVEMALPALSFQAGEDYFVKLAVRSLSVVPLLPWLSLRHSVRYDQGLPFGAPVLPKVERFFAGGDTTIRGFELDRARSEVIRSPLSPGVNSVQYRPVGGSLRILHNIDLQFPIMRPWYGAVFLDSGVVADSFDGLGAARFRHGVGISPLLVKLPIGDISLSWGWPLDPQPGDTPIGRLHFNVGLMF
jgi:outer membrane protein insertion porin family